MKNSEKQTIRIIIATLQAVINRLNEMISEGKEEE